MHIILYLLQVELIRKMCVIMMYWMMKSKRWNIDQLYHLSKLLENKMKKIWRGEKIVKLSWQARDCNDDVLKVTALCCSIIIYSFFCSQSIYLNLGRLCEPGMFYQEPNVCKVSKSVKGGSGPAFRAEARENFWVMVLGTKGFPVLVEWQL